MAASIADKLRIKKGFTLLTIAAPASFKTDLESKVPGIIIKTTGQIYNQVHWFVKDRAILEKGLQKVLKLLRPEIIIWVYYPKGSSGVQTDLTRDKGWESLLKVGSKLTWISLISFDKTWSAFGFRLKTDVDLKKEATPKTREIFDWVNPKTKEVRLPDDVANSIKKDKKAADYFETLSFSNKKEYLEWIVTAKRAETRVERIKGTIERLNKNWKNPGNI